MVVDSFISLPSLVFYQDVEYLVLGAFCELDRSDGHVVKTVDKCSLKSLCKLFISVPGRSYQGKHRRNP